MARQKGSHRFLILLRGKGAGGVNQPPAGTHQLRAGIQNFRLPPGTHPDGFRTPVGDGCFLLAEHTLAGAGRINEHLVKSTGKA